MFMIVIKLVKIQEMFFEEIVGDIFEKKSIKILKYLPTLKYSHRKKKNQNNLFY